MKSDLYTKFVMTVIAVLLAAILYKLVGGQSSGVRRPQQYRDGQNSVSLDIEARATAKRIWDMAFRKCRDSYYYRQGQKITQSSRPSGDTPTPNPETLTPAAQAAAQANGVQWKGTVTWPLFVLQGIHSCRWRGW